MYNREKTCALYIRLSKEDESEGPSQSVRNQRAMLADYARKSGFPIRDFYIDDGYSGTNFDRPGFRRMIADIEAGEVGIVVTKDLSRLGRDYIGTGFYLERWFPEHGVRYISLLDGIDTAFDSGANDFTPFRAVLNDLYARDISRKIKSVKRDKQRKGAFIGPKPAYGYKKPDGEKNRLIPDADPAAVVRRIFDLALLGASFREIAQALNAQAIPPPGVYAHLAEKGAWSGEAVSRILRNRVYIGAMVQGKSARASYKSKKCLRLPKEAWQVVEGTHEPLVERAKFDAVQRMLDAHRRTRARRYTHALKGMIFCGSCGRALTLSARKGKEKALLYFVCPGYKKGVCACPLMRAERAAALLREALFTACPFLNEEYLLRIGGTREDAKRFLDTMCEDPAVLSALVERIELGMDRSLRISFRFCLPYPCADVSRIEKKAVRKLGEAMQAPKTKKNKGNLR